jgi:DNA gyrase/topoisomerase IV subunit B
MVGEGDSAVDGAVAKRDPKIHGMLPLRGKIMNVNGERLSAVVSNEALSDIISSLGLVLNERAVRANLRYGKLFIATDEDDDGNNIFALLINFLFSFWPELFDKDLDPFVYRMETPLLILSKGKERQYFYGRNSDEFDPKQWKGWDVSRAKGLGRLEPMDWKLILSEPSVIPIIDGDKLMKDALSLIFEKSRADDRKIWLGEK